MTRSNQIRGYTARMDSLSETYWDVYEQWLDGDVSADDLEEAHHNWAREWLHGL